MLLLLHGKERSLVAARLAELKEQAEKQGNTLWEVDCAKESAEEALSRLNTSSLFGASKLAVFKDALATEVWEEKDIQKALLRAKAHTLVFVAEDAKKSHALVRLVVKEGKVEEFLPLKGRALESWLSKEQKKLKLSFAPRALEHLLLLCGESADALWPELQKLAAFPQRPISKEHIEELVSSSRDPVIFDTIDAIAAKDRNRALVKLRAHLRAGEPPLRLLSMFAWQLRTLVAFKDLRERKVPLQKAAQALRLHPFVAQKSSAALRLFSLKELKDLYRGVFALDLAMKTGKGNPEQLLCLFVAKAASKQQS